MALDFQYDDLLISNEKISNLKTGNYVYGYSFNLQYPSYRGTFLSCIEALEITVDGKKIPEKDIRFHVNGKEFLVSELSELCHEYWFILDKAKIIILKEGGILKTNHNIKVYLKHRVPYTGYFGQYLVLESICEKTL